MIIKMKILQKLELNHSNLHDKKMMYLRISVPGPVNESHVISIDQDSKSKTLRDLFDILNKKTTKRNISSSIF